MVVTILVDQLAAWVAAERLALLPESGGFRRLMREGTTIREARLPYSVTDTAPGHAMAYTGAPPRASGVTANERVDPDTRERVSMFRDPDVRLVGLDGPMKAIGSSAASIDVPTLADGLRERDDKAVIVSLSFKDRGSISGGGRHPTAALWFDPASDQMVTSTAFASSLPSWARPASSSDALAGARSEPWTPLDRDWIAHNARTPDDQPGEGAWPGLGTVFPHDFNQAKSPPRAFRGSPYADTVLLDLARRAIDSPGFGVEPTLLALSLSANDYIGHVYGPDSWEAWDELRRVDTGLAGLLSALDARFGPNGYGVLLTADHGIAPLPETAGDARARPWCGGQTQDRWERPCERSGRLLASELIEQLHNAAVSAVGAGDWVLGVAEPYVVLTDAARALPARRRDALVTALRRALERRREVALVIDTRTIAQSCPPIADESLAALVCRAYAPGAGDLYVVAERGSFFDAGYTPGKGTSHGTPYLYDRTVPILARAPARIPAGVLVDEPRSFATFARTAAALLDLHPPAASIEGTNLTERARPEPNG